MNERIKWLSTYLDQDIIYVDKRGIPDKNITQKLTPYALHLFKGDGNMKLILKELKDIGGRDLVRVSVKSGLTPNFVYKFLNQIENGDFIDAHRIVDACRELGYAYGVPKEYYITEDELKQLKTKEND